VAVVSDRRRQIDAQWLSETKETRARILALLKRVEWTAADLSYRCSVCRSQKHLGHAHDCELAALIRELS
jgi:hypothetical protein